MMVRYPEHDQEICDVISEIENPGRNKESLEKTKTGKMLYAPKELNNLFTTGFCKRGWSEIRDYYDIELPDYPCVVKGAFKQCDFRRDKISVEVQFGGLRHSIPYKIRVCKCYGFHLPTASPFLHSQV